MTAGVQASVAAIFVHGFYGHSEQTWFQFQTIIDSASSSGILSWWTTCDAYFYSYDSKRQFGPNASQLLGFIENVFPNPNWDALGAAGVEYLARRYKTLILIGHSEGAVLVRSAILRHVQANSQPPGHSIPENPILDAHLRLFAPAIWGSLVSGWKGILLRSPILGDLLEPYLHSVPAYQQLKHDSPLLTEIRRRTVELAKDLPSVRALRARNVFGANDDCVCMEALETDPPAVYEQGRTHIDICKPNDEYLMPLSFVRHDETDIAVAS